MEGADKEERLRKGVWEDGGSDGGSNASCKSVLIMITVR